jgi:hypothetical protein
MSIAGCAMTPASAPEINLLRFGGVLWREATDAV